MYEQSSMAGWFTKDLDKALQYIDEYCGILSWQYQYTTNF